MERICLNQLLKKDNIFVFENDSFSTLDVSGDDLTIIIKKGIKVNLLLNNIKASKNIHVDVEEDAKIELFIFVTNKSDCLNVDANVKENGEIYGYFLDFASDINNSKIVINLNGEGAIGKWSTASLAVKNDRKIIDVSINHNRENTKGLSENFGIAKESSSLSFLGISDVKQEAVKTETRQVAKIVVFDKEVKAKASPILKIAENNIIASHAASVGTLNEDHIFYLTSKGLSENEARTLITLGYLNPTINKFDKEVIEHVNEILKARM